MSEGAILKLNALLTFKKFGNLQRPSVWFNYCRINLEKKSLKKWKLFQKLDKGKFIIHVFLKGLCVYTYGEIFFKNSEAFL